METGVLVLNFNYEPLNICGLQRGMVLLYLGKAEVLRFSDDVLTSAAANRFWCPAFCACASSSSARRRN
jgi:hypothetical protein